MKKRFEQSEDEDSGSEPEQQPSSRHGPAAAAGGGGGGSSSDEDGGASDSDEDGAGPSGSGGTSEDEDDNSDDERALQQQLADIPLEVLARLKQDGLGPVGETARAASAAAKKKVFGKRETKNRPQEVSSKRPVTRFREVIQVPKQ